VQELCTSWNHCWQSCWNDILIDLDEPCDVRWEWISQPRAKITSPMMKKVIKYCTTLKLFFTPLLQTSFAKIKVQTRVHFFLFSFQNRICHSIVNYRDKNIKYWLTSGTVSYLAIKVEKIMLVKFWVITFLSFFANSQKNIFYDLLSIKLKKLISNFNRSYGLMCFFLLFFMSTAQSHL